MLDKPYFHQENGKTELRIPLNPKQEHNLKAMLEFFPADANKIAARQLGARDWLSALSDPERREIAIYCGQKTLQEKYDALAHFHKLGWVGDLSLERAKKEIDDKNARKLNLKNKILAALEECHFSEMYSARLLLQG